MHLSGQQSIAIIEIIAVQCHSLLSAYYMITVSQLLEISTYSQYFCQGNNDEYPSQKTRSPIELFYTAQKNTDVTCVLWLCHSLSDCALARLCPQNKTKPDALDIFHTFLLHTLYCSNYISSGRVDQAKADDKIIF